MRNVRSFLALGIAALGLIMLIGQEAPATQAAETTTIVYWGTYTVDKNDQTPQFISVVTPLPCSDCYITSVTPELEVDADPTSGENWIVANYSSVPPARLHHMVMFNHAYTDATCVGSGSIIELLGDRFFASGDERGSLVFASGYGYYMPAASMSNFWSMQVMIHNLSLSNPHTYRLRMEFKHHPASDNLKRMTHLWLDQNNCDTSQYPVPAGYADDHWPWTSGGASGTADDVEGEIMGMGGHVHDWGASVAATLMKFGTGTETPICTSQGGYGPGSLFAPAHIASPGSPAAAHPADALVASPSDPAYDGHIESMTGCPVSVMIAPGDMLHLHTQYVSVGPQTDVMGIMGAWVYDNCWNASNPSQDDFLDDGGVSGNGDRYGDACDKDADGDSLCNDGTQGEGGSSCSGTDADDDNDGYTDEAESGWPVCVGSVNDDNNTPLFGTFADDTIVNDGCPAVGPAETDCTDLPMTGPADDDGDGWVNDGCAMAGTYSEGAYKIGTSKLARCNVGAVPVTSPSWPADLNSSTDSVDKITLTDLTSFLAPMRRLGTNPNSGTAFSARWDLIPGRGIFTDWINLNDLVALLAGTTGMPPMFGGARAFGGPACTGA